VAYGSHANPLFYNLRVLKLEQVRLMHTVELRYKKSDELK